jgi:ABC-type transport system involved in multi-copper enzyme maturation permease subunit
VLEMIAAEIFKASRKKRFWVLLAFFILVAPAFQLISAAFVSRSVAGGGLADGNTINTAINQISSPYNMARNSLGGLFQLMLLPVVAVMAIFLVSEERTFKMWKTILVANPDRIRVITAKFISGMLILAAVIFGGLLGSLVFGTLSTLVGLSSGFDGDWGAMVAMHFLQWLVLAAPLALGFLIAWLTASPAIAVIGVVVLPGLLETIIRAVLVAQVGPLSPLSAPFEAARLKQLLEDVPRFFLTPNISLGSRVLGQDAVNFLGTNAPVALPTLDWSQIGWSVGVSGVYFLLFAGLMIWTFTSRDVHE